MTARSGAFDGTITPKIVTLYRKAVALQADPDSTGLWEDDKPIPGHRREYLDTCRKLHTALGRKPWQAKITDTIGGDGRPPGWLHRQGPDKIADWLEAREIRRQLDAAIAMNPDLT